MRSRGEEERRDGGLPELAWSPRLVLLVLAASAVGVSTVVPVPLIIREVFDVAIPNGDRSRLVLLGMTLIGIMTLSAGAAVAIRHQILRLVQAHLADVRSDVASSLVAAPLAAIDNEDGDDVLDVMSMDTLRYSTMVSDVTGELIPSVISALAVSLVLVVMDPVLFVITAALLLPLIGLHRTLGTRLRARTSDYHSGMRAYSAGVSRLLRRAAVTKVHGAQDLEFHYQQAQIDELQTSSVRLDLARSSYQWALQSVVVLSALAVLVVGGVGVIDGSRSLGELFAFYAAVALIRPSLDTTVRSMPSIAAGRLARDRLTALRRMAEIAVAPGNEPLGDDLTIEVDAVGFDHGATPVLRDVSFCIRQGTVTVVRGPNGAGKTTLVRLLCGLYEPTIGQIRIGGRPLAQIDQAEFHRQVGVVFQEAIVAGETIREALDYGDHEVTPDSLGHALAVTGFDRILSAFPDGLDTRLGAGSVRLSGGERQRLAIAQALVRRPALLLLDEPTNHLDAEAVAAVVAGLAGGGPAIVVVTHEDSRRFRPDLIVELPGRSNRPSPTPDPALESDSQEVAP